MGLSAVITQALLPRQTPSTAGEFKGQRAGAGRIPAVEVLMVSYGARQLIRRDAQLEFETGTALGGHRRRSLPVPPAERQAGGVLPR